ncbi:MAG TPA: Fe-S-containing hydro-lyase [Clostridiales bacterium]|nr:Fe-S-containing hydro-lyase [Clostridiales bacterium]
MVKKVDTPLTDEVVNDLKAGDRVLLSGIIYTGRDAAHKRLAELINKGEELPMDIKNQTIYYVGPCPAKPGQVIGSAGPTTSGRMDAYAPLLMDEGLKGMIGKGLRNQKVVDSIIKNNAVYFAAVGGAGALLAEAIKEAEVIAFADLGAEAIYKLRVEDFPVTVIIDNQGNDLYKIGREKYKIV